MTQAHLIDAQTLAGRLGEDDLVIIDCSVVLHRPDGGGPYRVEAQGDAYRDAHIPGAIFADLVSVFLESLRGELGPYVEAETAPVFYCGGGISATVDIFAMALLGRDDVRLYDGSLTEWSANPDLPLETG